MIKTTRMLMQELSGYANPKTKIARLVKEKKLFPIIKGLYETRRDLSPVSLAGVIYGPSYLSFHWALSYYGMIPERVYGCTSATYRKNRHKQYATIFGNYFYRDVPSAVYPLELRIITIDEGYPVQIAAPEKALCDRLYTAPLQNSIKEIEDMLFENFRLDEDVFAKLNFQTILELAPLYGCTNLKLFAAWIKKNIREVKL